MGGKAFPNTSPMDLDTFWEVGLTAANNFMSMVPDLRYEIVGSRYSNRPKNDVDLVLECSLDDFKKIVASVPAQDVKPITSYTFSTRVERNGLWHQVDLIHSKDMAYSRFVYHQPTDTRYKGVHRNFLLMAIVKTTTTSVSDDVRVRQHLDLYDGLTELFQSNKGKHGPLARYRTIRKNLITTNVNIIIERFFDAHHSLDSFETIFDMVLDKRFVHFAKGLEILTEAHSMMVSHGIEIPNELTKILNTGD